MTAVSESQRTGCEAAVVAWARAQLDGHLTVTPIKHRPWASTWRLVSRDGISFLKAAGVATRYEAPLARILHRVAPAMVAPVLASQDDAGWLLLADAGPTLDERLEHEFQSEPWERMLARFGQLQQIAEPLVAELIAAGVPDERPHRLFSVLQHLVLDSPGGAALTDPQRRALLDQGERWSEAATDLAALPVPASVQHGDLHARNVAIAPDQLARFFDLGDASIAHPFTTLLVPLQVARSLGADERQLTRLRDSYLEAFTDRASLPDLRRGLDVALRCAVVPKASAWNRALLAAPADHPWGQPVVEYLRDLL
jgi:hypothetical protein